MTSKHASDRRRQNQLSARAACCTILRLSLPELVIQRRLISPSTASYSILTPHQQGDAV